MTKTITRKATVGKDKIPTKGPAMRVAVAKDVLKLLKKGLNAATGNYFSTSYNSTYEDTEPLLCAYDSKSLQKAIGTHAKYCHVCAKGAIVLAHIHLFNGVDYIPTTYISYRSREIWGTKNANLIESAFEAPGCCEYEEPKSIYEKAINFGRRYPDSTKRLRAIMNNVIANNGTFIP